MQKHPNLCNAIARSWYCAFNDKIMKLGTSVGKAYGKNLVQLTLDFNPGCHGYHLLPQLSTLSDFAITFIKTKIKG